MFGNVEIKSRPIRLAFLVEPNNQKQVKEAIRLSSTLWGGCYFPIIPIHKETPTRWRQKGLKPPHINDVVRGYIEAFDPDILVQLAGEIPTYIVDTGLRIIPAHKIWHAFNRKQELHPQFGIGIFEILNGIYEEYFKYKAKYPVNIVIPKIPHQYGLFWTSFFGEVPENILSELEKHYFEPLEITREDFRLSSLKEFVKGQTFFPRRITQYKLNHFVRSAFRRDAYIFFMDATKVEDIIDYWNLRALGWNGIPVPKQLQDNTQLKEIVVDFLKAYRRPWEHNPKVCDCATIIKARSCTVKEIEDFAKTLKINRQPGDPSDSPYYSLQHWYPRIWDEWARAKDGADPDDIYGVRDSIEIDKASEFKVQYKALLPEFAAKKRYFGQPCCANEISFSFYGGSEMLAEVFPKSTGENLIRAISGIFSIGDWRIGRNGLVQLVKSSRIEQWDIPLAERIVFAWLKDKGWETKLSAPGLLAKQIYRKANGSVTWLANEKLLKFFEHMSGGSVQRDGNQNKDEEYISGKELKEDGQVYLDRDMIIGEVVSQLKNMAGFDLHEKLISEGIFKLGLRVSCPYCIRGSWFPLVETTETLICPKCLNKFPAIGNVNKGKWHYKTAGPFSVPKFADGAYTVLIAVDFLSSHKMDLHTSPVFSFSAESLSKKPIEVDFAMFWQETTYGEERNGLLFGECKTFGEFKTKDYDRMRILAREFPGAILAFCSLGGSLTEKEVIEITKIAKRGRKLWKAEQPINPVLILTGTELFSTFGPPECWEDAGKSKRFDTVRGLLDLCDTSQQIYLNLPSWHDEWREKWAEKRKKWQEKQKTK